MLVISIATTSCQDLFVFHNNPKIVKGYLDLTNFDLSKHKPIHIIGESELYWKQLLEPSNFQSPSQPTPDCYIQVPGVWNGKTVNGITLGGDGYATYRFKIKTKDDGIYGLKINEFDCAYKIWVNGVVDSVGRVATSKTEMIPAWNRRELYFNSINKEIEVIIQISNFNHRKGGPEDVITFGTANEIIKLKQKQIDSNIFLLSIIVLTGLTHLLVFILRKKDKSALLFSLLCFAMAIRLITTSEKLLLDLIPSIPWHIAVRLEYFSYTIAAPLMAAFIRSYYPSDFSRKFVKAIFIIAILFSASYFLTSVKIFSYTPIVYQAIVAVTAIYIFYALLKAYINKRENAILFLGSYIFFFLIVINDVLYYNKLINTSFLMPVGLALMVVSQSFALTKRQVKAFAENEKLSKELDLNNRELEKIVDERTQKVINQKEELEAQAEKLKDINDRLVELSKFKDNMTGMVVHDMKNHLNSIILLSDNTPDDSDDYLNIKEATNHSAKQLLTLVMNILDVQHFEEARFELSLQNTDLFPTVENVKKDLDIMSRMKGIQILNQCKSEYYTNSDPAIIHRVFINLISNAIKFSPSNSEIIIKSEDQDDFIKCMVIDKGAGIPETIKDKIFDKFETYNHPSTQRYKSTGLGLTFCKLAVEAHGGQIGVDSEIEKGSVFWFTLPKGEKIERGEKETTETLESNRSISLSEIDINNLYKYGKQLSTIKYYEVTRINILLSQIKEDLGVNYNDSIKSWVEEIKKSTIYSDKELYETKIKDVLGTKKQQ